LGRGCVQFFSFAESFAGSGFWELWKRLVQKRFGGDLQLLIFATRFETEVLAESKSEEGNGG
jgi:hypothetical protein